MLASRYPAIAALLLIGSAVYAGEDRSVGPASPGRPGGRLISGERAEPKTLNPLFLLDGASRLVTGRLMADLVHINRSTLKTEPALAKTCTASRNGLRYDVELRQGLKFSDGQPFDADDVLFTFQVVLDPNVNASQRGFWVFDGKPVVVRKTGPYHVVFEFPQVNAVGDRIFDGVPMLPRHLLEPAYLAGKIRSAWGLLTPPAQIAGLGPFRLKHYTPGQQIVLERNPFYWKTDAAGARTPYLDELTFTFAPAEDTQVLRFRAGESDVVARISPRSYAALEKESARRGYVMQDAGPSLEHSFLFFNLNPASGDRPWKRVAFRRAVSAALDRQAMVRLIYQGFGDAIASPVGAGNRPWLNAALPKPVRSVDKARQLLAADGFSWGPDRSLRTPGGGPVRFSLIVGSSNPERVQMATLAQADLEQIGIKVDVVPMELGSVLERVTRTGDFEASILTMGAGDMDPNSDLPFWLSSGAQHISFPNQKTPGTPWEAEIDQLMGKQLVARRYEDRKKLFDRVQEISAEYLPVIPLVSPHVLVGAKKDLANFRPTVVEPHALWNVDELFWRTPGPGPRR